MRSLHILIIIKVWIAYKAFRILPTKRKYFIAPLAGRITDRYGRYWFFLLGLLVTGGTFCLYSLPFVTAWAIVFISLLEGAGAAVVRSALDGFLADVMPQQVKGKVQANFSSAGLIGNLLGSPALLPVLSCFYLDWHGNSILLTKKCQKSRNLLLPKLRLKRELSSDERYFRQV